MTKAKAWQGRARSCHKGPTSRSSDGGGGGSSGSGQQLQRQQPRCGAVSIGWQSSGCLMAPQPPRLLASPRRLHAGGGEVPQTCCNHGDNGDAGHAPSPSRPPSDTACERTCARSAQASLGVQPPLQLGRNSAAAAARAPCSTAHSCSVRTCSGLPHHAQRQQLPPTLPASLPDLRRAGASAAGRGRRVGPAAQ